MLRYAIAVAVVFVCGCHFFANLWYLVSEVYALYSIRGIREGSNYPTRSILYPRRLCNNKRIKSARDSKEIFVSDYYLAELAKGISVSKLSNPTKLEKSHEHHES